MANYNNTFVLKLDVKEQQPNPVMRIVQYDTVYFNIELYDAGKKMEIDKGDRFVVSVEHEKTGKRESGLAEYDGSQFIVYNLRDADMSESGTWIARFSVFKDNQRVTSLKFRYEVVEDLLSVGEEVDLSLAQQLFKEVQEIGGVAQRQGEYAEDRGDYANAAGDYANRAGDSNMLNWLPYVRTTAERNNTYPNPKNGDVLYVIDENKVFRYDAIDAMDWEAIAGWDVSVIQDIYNVKADKVQMMSITDAIKNDLKELTIGGRNLVSKTAFTEDFTFKTTSTGYTVSTNKDTKIVLLNADGYQAGRTYSLNLGKNVEAGTYVNLSFYAKPLAAGGTIKFKIGNGTFSPTLALGNPSSDYQFYTLFVKTNHTSDANTIYIEQSKGLEIRGESLKVEQGNRPTAWTYSLEDIDTKLTALRNDITAHAGRINSLEYEMNNNVVKKTVMEQSLDGMEQKLAQIQQTADGITSTVSKKIGADEVKSIINQTADAVRIKASNIDFDGAVVFKNTGNVIDPNAYVSIANGELTIKGYYNRIWRDGKARNREQYITFVDGMMRVTDPKGDYIDSDPNFIDWTKFWNDHDTKTARSLYYTSDGISTYRDGTGKYTTGDGSGTGNYVASGTIEFFSHEYSDTRGITMMSANGAVGIHANNHNAVIHAGNIVYNRSKKSVVCLQPHKDVRNGNNNFIFGVNPDLTGYVTYGDNGTDTGAGFLFGKSKAAPTITAVDGGGKPSGAVTFITPKLQADVITNRSGKNSVYFNGSGGVNLAASTSLQADGIRSNSNNFYIGVAGELRVTNKNGYNNGKTMSYLPVRASKFNTVSSKKYKSNIEDLSVDSIELLKKTNIKQYNLNTDIERGIKKTKYGVILEEVDELLHEDDAIDIYAMVSLLWDASKKQQEKIEELEAELKKLKK